MRGVATIELALAADASAPRVARRAVQQLLVEDVGVAFVHNAILLTSELVTNVTMYTADGCRLNASFDPADARLRVEVADASSTIPTIPTTADSREPGGSGGLGLQLVDAVATRWGVTSTPAGKTIWFEIER
jgi:hypothetical protein